MLFSEVGEQTFVKQHQILEKSPLSSDLSHHLKYSQNFCQPIQTWPHLKGKISLFYTQNEGLTAQLETGEKITAISRLWIVGIPKILESDKEKLTEFIRNTYPTLAAHDNDAGYTLYINPRIYGGGKPTKKKTKPNEPKELVLPTQQTSVTNSQQTSVIKKKIKPNEPKEPVLPTQQTSVTNSQQTSVIKKKTKPNEPEEPISPTQQTSVIKSNQTINQSSEIKSEVTQKTISDSGQEIMALLINAMEETETAKNKTLIALVGKSGCGKSTAINWLLGLELVKSKLHGKTVFNVDKGQKPYTEIGNDPRSQTLYTKVCTNDSGISFADCGGFLDTRGCAFEIAAAYSTKLSLETAKGVKLLLCCSERMIDDARRFDFSEFLKNTLRKFLKNYDTHEHSVCLMVTQPTGNYTKKDIIERLRYFQGDCLPNGEEWTLYEYILRKEGNYICICDPQNSDSKDEILNLLVNEMSPIDDCKHSFHISCSTQSQAELLDILRTISDEGNSVFQTLSSQAAIIEERQRRIQEKTAEIKNLEDQIDILKKPTDVHYQQQQQKEFNDKLIAQIQERIENEIKNIVKLEEELKGVNKDIKKINSEITTEKSLGDVDVECWTDKIHQDGIKFEVTTKTITKTIRPHWIFWTKEDEPVTDSTTTDHNMSIKRDFCYPGPIPFSKYEYKSTNEEDEWTNLTTNQDKTQFSIQYKTEKGKEANAEVKIFIKRKDSPKTESTLLKFQNKLTELNSTKGLLELRLEEAQKAQLNAKSSLNFAVLRLNDLVKLNDHLKQLNQEKNNYENDFKIAIEKKKQSIKDIEKNIDFQFVINYSRLVDSEDIEKEPVIGRFLDNMKDYKKQKK